MTIEELKAALAGNNQGLGQSNQSGSYWSQPCPACGHCPHCGRGGHQAQPFYPTYPNPSYPQPMWISYPRVTC